MALCLSPPTARFSRTQLCPILLIGVWNLRKLLRRGRVRHTGWSLPKLSLFCCFGTCRAQNRSRMFFQISGNASRQALGCDGTGSAAAVVTNGPVDGLWGRGIAIRRLEAGAP
jgi:hypothetical protein